MIEGRKSFITNGDVADVLLVFGKWAGIDDPRKAISAIVVEKGTPGLSVLRTEDKLGHRASSTAALAFDGCRVPRANLLGAPGDGIAHPARLAQHLAALASRRMRSASRAPPSRTRSLTSTSGARAGSASSTTKGIQFMLADHAADLALAEAWLWHVGRLVDAARTISPSRPRS